jgi:hypothetical protein
MLADYSGANSFSLANGTLASRISCITRKSTNAVPGICSLSCDINWFSVFIPRDNAAIKQASSWSKVLEWFVEAYFNRLLA